MQVCTSLKTDNHASNPPLSFLQAGCPSCHPTNSVKALKGKDIIGYRYYPLSVMDNHTNTSLFNFYRPDALPDAQPTVSKH